MEMRKLNLILALLIFPMVANAAAPTRAYNYTAHTTIDPTQNNSNENTLYSYLQAGVDTYAGGSITNSAVSSSAAIAYSKLNLSGSILNADISNSAAITYSKLNLTGGIVNADISGSAAIADSKLATISTAGKVNTSSLTGLVATANLGSGATAANFLRGDQTYASATPTSVSFSVNNNGVAETISSLTQQLTFSTEEWDTNNNFSSNKFTPTVAGKYQLSASALMGGNGAHATDSSIALYKNGSLYKNFRIGGNFSHHFSVTVDANGSTDYFEVYMLNSTGSADGDPINLFFTGARVF